jgi:uncharacterized protein YcbK (DUF882 family)
MKRWILFLAAFLIAVGGEAKPRKSSQHGASLKGSAGALEKQKKMADREKLPKIKDDKALRSLKRQGKLRSLPSNDCVAIDPRLGTKWRAGDEEVVDFLRWFGCDVKRHTGKSIRVTSAVRTLEKQKALRGRGNRNATLPDKSSHVRGATVDIAKTDRVPGWIKTKHGKKRGLVAVPRYTPKQLAWMREHLLALEREGLIEATEEFRQPVFHIMVFRKFQQKIAEK